MASAEKMLKSGFGKTLKTGLGGLFGALGLGGGGASSASGLLASIVPQQAEPVEAVPTMPTPNGDDVRRAKRKSLAAQMQRRGRASTILTDEPLGAGL